MKQTGEYLMLSLHLPTFSLLSFRHQSIFSGFKRMNYSQNCEFKIKGMGGDLVVFIPPTFRKKYGWLSVSSQKLYDEKTHRL